VLEENTSLNALEHAAESPRFSPKTSHEVGQGLPCRRQDESLGLGICQTATIADSAELHFKEARLHRKGPFADGRDVMEELNQLKALRSKAQPLSDKNCSRLLGILDAFHEAGHAAVALHLGSTVHWITMNATFRQRMASDHDEICVVLAGERSEARISPKPSATSSSRGDHKTLRRLTGRPARDVVRQFAPAVEAILNNCWPLVQALAQALLDNNGRLDAEQIIEIYDARAETTAPKVE
jgi:hypothetical protein